MRTVKLLRFSLCRYAKVTGFESSILGLNQLLNIHNHSRTKPFGSRFQHSHLSFMSLLFFVVYHRPINTLFVSLISWLKLLWMPSANQSHILFIFLHSNLFTLISHHLWCHPSIDEDWRRPRPLNEAVWQTAQRFPLGLIIQSRWDIYPLLFLTKFCTIG